jgi:hypothetical protein
MPRPLAILAIVSGVIKREIEATRSVAMVLNLLLRHASPETTREWRHTLRSRRDVRHPVEPGAGHP